MDRNPVLRNLQFLRGNVVKRGLGKAPRTRGRSRGRRVLTTRSKMTKITNKRIIIMAKSDIGGGRWAPTQWGYPQGFESVKEAERCAEQSIKILPWVVARESERVDESGKIEYEYSYLTAPKNPRRFSGED